MDDASRLILIAGPYIAPQVRRGDWLDCEIAGRVQVGGITDAPIPWPRRLKTGRPSLIVCGDLVRAIQIESEIAVSHWWGVGIVTVWAWRRALGVGRVTSGTERLYAAYQPTKLTPEVASRGRQSAATPDAIERMRETKTGAALPPRTDAHRAALATATKAAWNKRKGTT